MEIKNVDVAFWPREGEEGLATFKKLLKKLEDNAYDDEFLVLLDKYRHLYPESEHVDIFAARFAFAYGDYQTALDFALSAFHKRKVNLVIWQLLAECYEKLGNLVERNRFLTHINILYGIGMELQLDGIHDGEILAAVTMAGSLGNFAPFLLNKAVLNNGSLEKKQVSLAGEFIPESFDDEGYGYWVGAYVNQEILNAKGQLLAREAELPEFMDGYGADFVYDIMRAKELSRLDFDPLGREYILPIAGNTDSQELAISAGQKSYNAVLGRYEYSYYKISEPVSIQSPQVFVVGKPVQLGHSPKRKKVVLNILVDALSWQAVKERNYSLMPNTMKFFRQGIIFDQHFSVSEYTYPSLPTIETGLYPHHSQLFAEHVNVPLDRYIRTISEQMGALGYYCVNVMGGGHAIYNGAVRGYDHFVSNSYAMRAYEGVERTIQQLEAFAECDQFLFLHIMDVHPWPIQSIQVPLASQTRLSLDERLFGTEEKVASVYMKYAPLYADANMQGIRNTDRSLGVLFDYLQAHYDEDEYVVQLYSDHGCSVYDDYPCLLGDYQTNGAYMVRGSGIPALGIVDELTSALDIYQVMAHCHGFSPAHRLDGNLPEAFGGRRRESVISNSIFPGQSYKLCIRTDKYEFQLESRETVDEDGTVDLTGASMYVLERGKDFVQNYDLDVLRYFMDIARAHTASFNHQGRYWQEMRRERANWFETEQKGTATV